MKKLMLALLGLVILQTACKKDENGNPCTSEGKKQAWKKNEGNPVLVKTEKSWDDGIVLGHAVIRSGDIYKMWYSGGHDVLKLSIGYATSPDGINWTKYGKAPVFEGKPGSWDELGVSIPVVLEEANMLHLWYLGGSGPDGGKIGYATSADGIHWKRHPSPVFESLPGSWYRDALMPGTVIKEHGKFKMWFSGSIGSLQQSTPTTANSVGYATSYDGIHWTVYDDTSTTNSPFQSSDPVLKHGGAGEWDQTSALTPSVVKTKCGFEMWYTGENLSLAEQHIGYAFSPDGIHWKKDPRNPVLRTDPWNISLVFPNVILNKNNYHMWYGGFLFEAGALGGAIGYATMPK